MEVRDWFEVNTRRSVFGFAASLFTQVPDQELIRRRHRFFFMEKNNQDGRLSKYCRHLSNIGISQDTLETDTDEETVKLKKYRKYWWKTGKYQKANWEEARFSFDNLLFYELIFCYFIVNINMAIIEKIF